MLEQTQKKIDWQTLMLLAVVGLSFMTTLLIIVDDRKPDYYGMLFSLPLFFGMLSIAFRRLYREIFLNFGITILLVLFFVRMVVTPLMMSFGSYAGTLTKNVDQNTLGGILLVLYESVAVFVVMFYMVCREKDRKRKKPRELSPKITTTYTVLLIFMLMLLGACLVITPQILKAYRTLFQLGDDLFTAMEDSYIIDTYGTTFLTKFSLVTGMYLMRAALLIVPAYIITMLAKGKRYFAMQTLSLFACIIPLFFIPGAIAKSLIYMVCLLLFRNHMFYGEKLSKKIIFIFVLAAAAVIAWWLFRSGGNIWEQFSRRFSSYFSGVNVVSGTFNLPVSASEKLRLFFYDFLGTVPYGNTIFGLTGESVQPFFNAFNESAGQIPTTIGMGYYYFGPLFAPLYSMIFVYVAVDAGIKLKNNHNDNPFRCIRLFAVVFYFSMGVVMYNIDITMTNFFSLLLPMYIIERLSYRRRDKA